MSYTLLCTLRVLAVVLGACYMYATHPEAGYAPLIAQTALGWFILYAWEFLDAFERIGWLEAQPGNPKKSLASSTDLGVG